MARQTAEHIRHQWLGQASTLLRHHARESLNSAYRELLDDAGVDPATADQTAATWSRVPIIDKQWLARHCGDNALVTVATDPLDEQLRRANAFEPDTISGSPGFLQQIARTAAALYPALLLYGGADLADTDADRLRARFPAARLTAFYPTTEAGAGLAVPLPPDAAGALIAALGRSGEPLRDMGERDADALAAGPLAGLLTSAEDTETAWIRAGLAWQRLALAAHSCGQAVAPLTAVVENPPDPPGRLHPRPGRSARPDAVPPGQVSRTASANRQT